MERKPMQRTFGNHWYRNRATNEIYHAATGLTWLWWCLFGPIWMMYRGFWVELFVGLVLASSAIIGIPFFIAFMLMLPFFAYRIIRYHYTRNGWYKVTQDGDPVELHSIYLIAPPHKIEGEV